MRTHVEVKLESAVDTAVAVVVGVDCGGAWLVSQTETLAARETRSVPLAIGTTTATSCAVVLSWENKEIGRYVVVLPVEDAGVEDGGTYIRLVALETLDAGLVVTTPRQLHPSRRYVTLRNEDLTRTSPEMQLSLETDCQNLSAALDLPEIAPGAERVARISISSSAFAPELCRVWGASGDTTVSFFLFHLSKQLPPVLLGFPQTVSCSDGSLVIQNGEVFDIHAYLDTPLMIPEDAGVRLLDDWLERELPEGQLLTVPFECDPRAPPVFLEINSNFPSLRIQIQP
ncbi:MAG: hypothetical protein IT380_26170 [Myxococcales bacterium]|nr:hypothetical protein [Myxococcales bacterium]